MDIKKGFYKTPNYLAEAFACVNLSPYESRVSWALMRRIWGWNKTEDAVSYSQLEKSTGIDKRNICRAIQGLIDKKVIFKKANSRINIYSFNMKTEEWSGVEKDIVSNDNVVGNDKDESSGETIDSLSKETSNSLSAETTTKDTGIKTNEKTDNIQKKTTSNRRTPVQQLVERFQQLHEERYNRKAIISNKDWGKWGKLVKSRKKQGIDIEELIELLELFANSKDSDPKRLGFNLNAFLSTTVINKLCALKDDQGGDTPKYGKYKKF